MKKYTFRVKTFTKLPSIFSLNIVLWSTTNFLIIFCSINDYVYKTPEDSKNACRHFREPTLIALKSLFYPSKLQR